MGTSLAIGQVLKRYRIISCLGQGGMGAVYSARHLNLNTTVAIKEMIPQPGLDAHTLTQLRRQFQQEATVLAHLNHPHMVHVIDFFEEKGNAYLVMDFVEGKSLADRVIGQRPLPEREVMTWAKQLLDALAYCHSQGVIHRDIKPQNIVIRPDGRAMLVDFGLVKLWDPSDPRTKTAMRGMGTPEYAPPEQYDVDPGHTDPRSDIYSLGATLYHLLTGQSPPTATQRMTNPASLKAPRTLNPRLSIQIEQGILKAIEPQPGHRFQSAKEMAAALSRKVPAPARTTARKRQPTKVKPKARPTTRARRKSMPGWAWVVGGVAAVALLVVLGRLVFGGGAAKEPTQTLAPTVTPTVMPAGTPTAKPTSTPIAESVSSAGATQIRPVDDMVMVYVPGGTFQMGSSEGDSDADDDEFPQHSVILDGFWIDQTEVTNAQFAAFLNDQGNQTKGGVTWLELDCYYCLIGRSGDEFRPKSVYADYPVTMVSWYGADAYCKWVGAQLPTEAQWEYAARGEQGYIYPWGNDAPTCELAQSGDCSGRTVPVGSLPDGASWCKALDMAGNVWEWTADWYGSYSSASQTNPTGPSDGSYKVVRGGSFNLDETYVRAAFRSYYYFPDSRTGHIGFRCAGVAPGQ